MILQLNKSDLKGRVMAPPSKSMAHRAVICSKLAEMMTGEKSELSGISESNDIKTTIAAMESLKTGGEIFCSESGSTLRFLIPVAAALGGKYIFTGTGRLGERPIEAYAGIFDSQGIYNKFTDGKLPYEIDGKLRNGVFKMRGDVSSQYISGLMFALPLLDGDSVIEITTDIESEPYIDLTIDVLNVFGIEIEAKKQESCYYIKGNQVYRPAKYEIEGDYSQAAFWAGAQMLGMDIEIDGLKSDSKQGDREIIRIADDLKNAVISDNGYFIVDASQIPDLVPVITVMAAFTDKNTRIINAGRLRIKESDRLSAISETVNRLGGNVTEYSDSLIIKGSSGELAGGAEINSFNDHRIAMAAAIAALRCKEPVILTGAESVNKSYPDFWDVYRSLGGLAYELDLG